MKLIHIPKDAEIPLIGLIQIGIIDRGSNLLQVRPTTMCNLNCTFCSTNQTIHKTNYIIEPNYLINWIKEVISLKQGEVSEINLDSVGECLTHPNILEIIKKISQIKEVKFISMQTNGTLLTKEKISALETAGLNRINLSIHTLDPNQAKTLAGSQTYNLTETLKLVEIIQKSKIELIITPVWISNINDQGIIELIKYCKKLNCKIGIQKYEEYKYSRKQENAKKISWYQFYKQLEAWEKEFDTKLKLSPHDFNIIRTKKIPLLFTKNEITQAKVLTQGWLDDQVIAISKNRSIAIDKCKAESGDLIKIKITESKNSIYLAKKI